jgi:N-ethylmaleimide reductase
MNTDPVFAAFSMGNFRIMNRIAFAPMTRGHPGQARVSNELMAGYYYQRASAGLLITEATVISEQGNGWLDSPAPHRFPQR